MPDRVYCGFCCEMRVPYADEEDRDYCGHCRRYFSDETQVVTPPGHETITLTIPEEQFADWVAIISAGLQVACSRRTIVATGENLLEHHSRGSCYGARPKADPAWAEGLLLQIYSAQDRINARDAEFLAPSAPCDCQCDECIEGGHCVECCPQPVTPSERTD